MTEKELAKIFCQLDEGCDMFKEDGIPACDKCRTDGEYEGCNWQSYTKEACFVLKYFVPKAKLCEAMEELKKVAAKIQTLIGE